MYCPYCKSKMEKGIISGDGRRKVRWYKDGKKIGLFDKMAGIGLIDAKYTLTKFEIESYYCAECHRMIFDTEISL